MPKSVHFDDFPWGLQEKDDKHWKVTFDDKSIILSL